VSIPQIELDDRRFQDLVNEARMRAGLACPEWTEHNVSDPGITLIELFAWMTEMLGYRLNRVPDKLHLSLLELLGIQVAEPVAATTEVRFRLSAPAVEPVEIPAGTTEVGTIRTASDESIVFQTSYDFTIPPARPMAYLVERAGAPKNIGVAAGVARPKGGDQLAFDQPPKVGNALYLGFDTSLARLLVRIDVDCSQARGAGVDPEDPPLRFEVSDESSETGWSEATVLSDLTGGFNYGSGAIELQLPSRHSPSTIAGQRAYWVRCRLDGQTRSGAPSAGFTHAPEIYGITAGPIGAVIPAAHSARHQSEVLGESDGSPAQRFQLLYAPVLEPTPAEHLEVLEPGVGEEWQAWEQRESFAESRPDDRHYVLDAADGTIELGPAVRAPDGSWRQYGRVPPARALLRMTGYRDGGGRRGNVTAGTLSVLKSAIPGVVSVTNPVGATGGVDLETIESTRVRAAMELRTRYRAVTAQDFEFLCGEASPRVARALCLPVREGSIPVCIVPGITPADRLLEAHELIPEDELMREVAEYLDERRLVGTTVELRPARYRGVSVVVNVQAARRADLSRVEADVAQALYAYLNPLVGGSLDGIGTGWEFGRALNQGELYGIVHAVEGVDFVKILRVYETDIVTGEQQAQPMGSFLPLEPDELVASARHVVKAEHVGV
jgi:predicted phage baseplate assembly protein